MKVHDYDPSIKLGSLILAEREGFGHVPRPRESVGYMNVSVISPCGLPLAVLNLEPQVRIHPLIRKRRDVNVSSSSYGGEGGIRTLGALRHTAFRERPVQPLLHLSIKLILPNKTEI